MPIFAEICKKGESLGQLKVSKNEVSEYSSHYGSAESTECGASVLAAEGVVSKEYDFDALSQSSYSLDLAE